MVVAGVLAVAVGMDLGGCLWLCGYGNVFEIFGFVMCQCCSGGGW